MHRWPQDSTEWDDLTQKQIVDSINKNPEKKQVTIKGKIIQIEDFEFTSLKNIGISVPFFKEECTLIFEAQFDKLFAHVHISIKSENYVDVFSELTSWKKNIVEKI